MDINAPIQQQEQQQRQKNEPVHVVSNYVVSMEPLVISRRVRSLAHLHAACKRDEVHRGNMDAMPDLAAVCMGPLSIIYRWWD